MLRVNCGLCRELRKAHFSADQGRCRGHPPEAGRRRRFAARPAQRDDGDAVVLAVSGYHIPNVARMSERLDASVMQLPFFRYRIRTSFRRRRAGDRQRVSPGCQIAEGPALGGRKFTSRSAVRRAARACIAAAMP